VAKLDPTPPVAKPAPGTTIHPAAAAIPAAATAAGAAPATATVASPPPAEPTEITEPVTPSGVPGGNGAVGGLRGRLHRLGGRRFGVHPRHGAQITLRALHASGEHEGQTGSLSYASPGISTIC